MTGKETARALARFIDASPSPYHACSTAALELERHGFVRVDEREDWLLAIDHVRSCGVEFVAGPYVHAHEGKDEGTAFTGGSGSHAFYFCDPDGNRIEFYCWMMNVTRPSVATREADL